MTSYIFMGVAGGSVSIVGIAIYSASSLAVATCCWLALFLALAWLDRNTDERRMLEPIE